MTTGAEDAPAEPRAARLSAALRAAAALGASKDLADRLCVAAAVALDVQGASLCVLFAPGMSVPVGVSDAVAERAEELQFSLGEGACWEGYASGAVVVADFADAVAVRRRWPVYAPAVQREIGYGCVIAVPVRLSSGLRVVLNVYEEVLPVDGWWLAAEVTTVLRQVLDAASLADGEPHAAGQGAGATGGAVWLDSSSTVRRGLVWAAEAMLLDRGPAMRHVDALRALRVFSAVEGVTVDAAAAALVQGSTTVGEVLGDA